MILEIVVFFFLGFCLCLTAPLICFMIYSREIGDPTCIFFFATDPTCKLGWEPHVHLNRYVLAPASLMCFHIPSSDRWKASIINLWYVSRMNTFAKACSIRRIINDNDGTQTQKKCSRSQRYILEFLLRLRQLSSETMR